MASAGGRRKPLVHPDCRFAFAFAGLFALIWLGSFVFRPRLPRPPAAAPGTHPAAAHEHLYGPGSGPGHKHGRKIEFWPVPKEWSSQRLEWKDHNIWTLRHLRECLDGLPLCSLRRRRIVLLQSKIFRAGEYSSGPEAEFSSGLRSALTTLDVSVLYVPNLDVASAYYAMFPGMVKAVVVDKPELNRCWADNNCIKSPTNPYGAPIQDLHEVSFNDAPAHPFGPEWMLSPTATSTPQTTAELLAWIDRDWTALASEKLAREPGLGGGLDFVL